MNEACLKIELKYCERCGGLFFRRDGSARAYCVSCAPEMAKVAHGVRKQPVSVPSNAIRGGAACA